MIRRISLVLMLCLCAVLPLFACSDNGSNTADGAMTALKDDSGAVTGYERRYHNTDGQLSRLDMYDADQTYLNYVLYEYDDNGRLYTETAYRADGIAESRNIYTYDDDGNLSEKSVELPHGEATVYRYDASGKEIERLYYDKDEQLYLREALNNGVWESYDADGNAVEE